MSSNKKKNWQIASLILLYGTVCAALYVLSIRYYTREPAWFHQIVSYNGIHAVATLHIFINGVKINPPIHLGHIHHHDGRAQIHEPGLQIHEDPLFVHGIFFNQVTNKDLMLGNLFTTWGHPFTDREFLGHSRSEGSLEMFVNGQPSDLFEYYPIGHDDVIVLRFESYQK